MSDMDRDAQLWTLKELYGIKSIPPAEDYETFIKAALICAKADGVLAPEERNWVVGRAATLRNPGYELAKNYPADEDLLDVVAKSSAVDKSGRRMLIYVAIQACAADGEYHPDERAKVHKMAKALGIEEDVVNQLEELCMSEAKIREQRIGLIFPEGVPY
ncbi:MAG: TerB family tellurite resistance protein [Hormoscilla sp.]